MRNIHKIGENIYITNDEKIKRSDYVLYLEDNSVVKVNSLEDELNEECDYFKKIILTNDPELKIQIIDDEFLEWFVKNPNCEEVEVVKDKFFESVNYHFYKTIIPKEEPKITNCGNKNCQSGVINGVNPKICRKCNPKKETKQESLAQERSYSEEDIKTAFREGFVKSYDDTSANSIYKREEYLTKWFKQFKKQIK